MPQRSQIIDMDILALKSKNGILPPLFASLGVPIRRKSHRGNTLGSIFSGGIKNNHFFFERALYVFLFFMRQEHEIYLALRRTQPGSFLQWIGPDDDIFRRPAGRLGAYLETKISVILDIHRRLKNTKSLSFHQADLSHSSTFFSPCLLEKSPLLSTYSMS